VNFTKLSVLPEQAFHFWKPGSPIHCAAPLIHPRSLVWACGVG
jgi:hypothetical protein